MVNNGFGNRKNHKKAIIAFSNLIEKKMPYKLYLYGSDMEKYGACYNWVIKKKIDLKNIFFMGYIDNHKLANIYKKSDIYLSTSLEETFGVTYGEAMASGLPIIAGKHSGATSETLKNCGILTDVKSPKLISNSIIKYNDKKFYKQINSKIPNIEIGGDNSERSAYEKIIAGASLLQLYTSFVYRGPSAAKDIKKEFIQILKAEGINNIKDAVGKGI